MSRRGGVNPPSGTPATFIFVSFSLDMTKGGGSRLRQHGDIFILFIYI
jgi:hypothetical protein